MPSLTHSIVAEAPAILLGTTLEYSPANASNASSSSSFDPFLGVDPFVASAAFLARVRGLSASAGITLGLPRLLALSVAALETNTLTRLASGSVTASATLSDLPTLSFDVIASANMVVTDVQATTLKFTSPVGSSGAAAPGTDIATRGRRLRAAPAPPPPLPPPPPSLPPPPSPLAVLIPAGAAVSAEVASALSTFVKLAEAASLPPSLFTQLHPILLELNKGSLISSGARISL